MPRVLPRYTARAGGRVGGAPRRSALGRQMTCAAGRGSHARRRSRCRRRRCAVAGRRMGARGARRRTLALRGRSVGQGKARLGPGPVVRVREARRYVCERALWVRVFVCFCACTCACARMRAHVGLCACACAHESPQRQALITPCEYPQYPLCVPSVPRVSTLSTHISWPRGGCACGAVRTDAHGAIDRAETPPCRAGERPAAVPCANDIAARRITNVARVMSHAIVP